MDMTDREFDQMQASVKRYAMRIARPLALSMLAYVLSSAQGYFGYPKLLIAVVVFVLASSSYGARAAYMVVLFLTALILFPPEAMGALQKGVAAIFGRSI